MAVKQFNFSVLDMRSKAFASFVIDGEQLGEAFTRGAKTLPATFGDKQLGLRLFRFEFQNTRTLELSGFIGQGETVGEAWADAVKGTRETFRPKNDGRLRPAVGLPVYLMARAGDTQALCRVVSRSIESFQSDETFDQERMRRAREAEARRLAEQGGRAA